MARTPRQVADGAVKIEGLAEFRRELKRVGGPELVQKLKDANAEVSTLVATATRRSMAGAGRMGAKAAESVRASKTVAGGQVRIGGRRYPYALGVEFGAIRGISRTVRSSRGGSRVVRGWNQFPAWRGNGADAGYHLFPAIREKQDEMTALYDEALDDIYRSVFPKG